MKKLGKTVFILIAAAHLSALATDSCKPCPEIKALEDKFLKLNFSSDFQAGAALVEQVFKLFDEAEPREKSAEGKAEFAALVKLSAAALPYDEESAVAEEISEAIKRNKDFQSVYEATLKTYTDSCRRDLLKAFVTERTCLSDLIERKVYEREGDKSKNPGCKAAVFDYEKCVTQAAKKKR